jgi:hypothetical protein
MNIFEGSRRVALLVKLLWVAAVVAITATTKLPSIYTSRQPAQTTDFGALRMIAA